MQGAFRGPPHPPQQMTSAMTKNVRQGSPEGAQRPAEAAGPSFEKALAELEKIVAQMEGGNFPLEQALAAHKRGLELARYCRDKLDVAQQQVQVLEGDVLKPFAASGGRPGGQLSGQPGDEDD